jgi:hypothetical protein
MANSDDRGIVNESEGSKVCFFVDSEFWDIIELRKTPNEAGVEDKIEKEVDIISLHEEGINTQES